MGHALNGTIQDIIVRQRRMQRLDGALAAGHRPRRHRHAGGGRAQALRGGEEDAQRPRARGLPGQGLGLEGAARQLHPRAVPRAWVASCDWTRTQFTMDAGLSRAVREAFVRLCEKGLVYRGARLVNWDCVLETAVSDDEIEYVPRKDKLYQLRYPVKGRPDDVRDRRDHAARDDARRHGRRRAPARRTLHGAASARRCVLPLRRARDPARRRRDRRARLRHGCGQGHARPRPGRLRARRALQAADRQPVRQAAACSTRTAGRSRACRARRRARRWSRSSRRWACWARSRTTRTTWPISDRSKSVIEPLVSEQWFVKMEPLAKPAIEAVTKRRAQVPAGALDQGLPRLAAQRARLVHQPPALVGAPDPGLVRRGRRARARRAPTSRSARRTPRRASRSCAATRTCSTRGPARGSGPSRRSAGRTSRPTSSASTRRSSSRPRARSSTCGSRAWSWPATSSWTTCRRDQRCPFEVCNVQRDRARRQGQAHVEVGRQRHRPDRDDRQVRRRRRALLAGAAHEGGPGRQARARALRGAASASPTRSGTRRASCCSTCRARASDTHGAPGGPLDPLAPGGRAARGQRGASRSTASTTRPSACTSSSGTTSATGTSSSSSRASRAPTTPARLPRAARWRA